MNGTIKILGPSASTGDISFSGSTISSSGTTVTVNDNLSVTGSITSSQAGAPILTSASSLTLQASDRVHVNQSPLRLYNVTTTNVTSTSTYAEVPASTVEVLTSYVQNASGEQYTSAGIELLRDFPPSTTNTAVQFFNTSNGKTVHLVVKRKFVRPTSESVDLSTDCLISDEYEQIVMVGAVADIVGATDIDASTQEFITEKLAAESYPVGSGERLRNALLRLRSLLIDEARGNLRSLYPAPVSIMNINYSA